MDLPPANIDAAAYARLLFTNASAAKAFGRNAKGRGCEIALRRSGLPPSHPWDMVITLPVAGASSIDAFDWLEGAAEGAGGLVESRWPELPEAI